MEERKLTIEDLAPYLPYRLKCISLKGIRKDIQIFELTGITVNEQFEYWTDSEDYCKQNNCVGMGHKSSELKPILRPMSDLTKEIEHNGEKFIPIDELNKIDTEFKVFMDDGYLYFEDIYSLNMMDINRIKKFYDWLYKHHFAVNIPEHLIIDINTI